MTALVLDSEALSQLVRARQGHRPSVVQDAIRAVRNRHATIVVPAAVLAEVYRGGNQETRVDSWLARNKGVRVVNTDKRLARQVGRILTAAGLGSAHHVDATVVAVATTEGGGLILTSDKSDLDRLVGTLPNIQVEPC